MERKYWIIVLLVLMLMLRLSISQPNVNSAQLKQLQKYFIALYEQYQQNVSVVDLEQFMDSRLMTRTNGIIHLIRGWSFNVSEESINVRTSLDYIRSVVLYACIVYVDSSYDSYFSTGGLDIDASLYATEIYQIRSNFVWTVEPRDAIVCFELAQFYKFCVKSRAVNNAPYVQFISTCTKSARFFYDMFSLSVSIPSLIENFMPVQRNPQSNILHEVQFLTSVQNVVINWDGLRKKASKSLRYQLFYLNGELQCALQKFIEDFAWQRDLTILTQRRKYAIFRLVSLVVLQQYMRFTFAEYDRHVCHPAHIKYAYVLSANLTTVLNENHIKIEHAYQEITAALDEMTENNNFFLELRPRISALPFRVGYVRYDDQLSLRIALSCQNQTEY